MLGVILSIHFSLFDIQYILSFLPKKKKKVLIHSFIYELENELETYTLHKRVYIYKVCFFKKKNFNLNTWFIQSNNNLIFNHYSSLYIIVKERWLTIIYNHITNVFVKKKKSSYSNIIGLHYWLCHMYAFNVIIFFVISDNCSISLNLISSIQNYP